MDTTEPTPPMSAEILKFDLPALLMQPGSGVDGEFLWPIAPMALATLYRSSAEHGRAISLKAASAFGGGLIGKGAARIDALCDSGATDMLVNLGVDLETYGNAFVQVIRAKDRIAGLRRLPAITMTRWRDGFLQRVPLPNGDTRKITFTADEVIQLKVPCPMGGRYALPEWIGTEGMLELARAAIAYNAKFFSNNAIPEHAVIFKGATPTRDQKDVVAAFFRHEYNGLENAHRTLLLHVGEDTSVTFERLTADVKDADFLKLIDAARDRIPIAHGVPPRMLGIVTAGALGGASEVSGQLFTFELLTLRPKRRAMLDQLRPILSALGLKPGDPDDGLADDQVAFRPLDLTPPGEDTGKLPDLVNSGILTPEEARLFLPGFEAGQGAAQATVQRSAAPSALDALVALLARV
ncbi:MAG: phage portal protein [Paracoccus sp. (in: a-proteobacteria)]|nr:phage portal protein [Paracoccus sp. (in: a-proteobacteria)]